MKDLKIIDKMMSIIGITVCLVILGTEISQQFFGLELSDDRQKVHDNMIVSLITLLGVFVGTRLNFK